MACVQLDTKVASNRDDIAPRDFDFIPFTQPSENIANNAKIKEARARDELRRVVRKRAMATYLREKRQNSKEQKQSTRLEILSMGQRHTIDTVPYGSSVDPFNTAPIKLEAYMYDLLQFCEHPFSSHSSTSNIGLIVT